MRINFRMTYVFYIFMIFSQYLEAVKVLDDAKIWTNATGACEINFIFKQYYLDEDHFIRVWWHPSIVLFREIGLYSYDILSNEWKRISLADSIHRLPIELQKLILFNLDLFTLAA